MRKLVVAANWKMHKTCADSVKFFDKLQLPPSSDGIEIIVCPPFTALKTVHDQIKQLPVGLGAQNFSAHAQGPYTGEISIPMIQALGCDYGIVGHSERRQQFHETDLDIGKKVTAAISAGLTPILCVGESLEQRQSNQMFDILKHQLASCLGPALNERSSTNDRMMIAYEPIWAIGTGQVATPEQAQEVHHLIRTTLKDIGGDQIAQETQILYGGSVKSTSVDAIVQMPDIDGVLVGGASLDPDEFSKIVALVAVQADRQHRS